MYAVIVMLLALTIANTNGRQVKQRETIMRKCEIWKCWNNAPDKWEEKDLQSCMSAWSEIRTCTYNQLNSGDICSCSMADIAILMPDSPAEYMCSASICFSDKVSSCIRKWRSASAFYIYTGPTGIAEAIECIHGLSPKESMCLFVANLGGQQDSATRSAIIERRKHFAINELKVKAKGCNISSFIWDCTTVQTGWSDACKILEIRKGMIGCVKEKAAIKGSVCDGTDPLVEHFLSGVDYHIGVKHVCQEQIKAKPILAACERKNAIRAYFARRASDASTV